MVRILYFGKLGDVAGRLEESVALPESVQDTAGLREWLETRFEGHGALKDASVRIALDGEIVADPHSLAGAVEIALIPPVGGG